MSNLPSAPPQAFVAGTNLDFLIDPGDYAPPTYACTWSIVSSSSSQSFAGVDDGNGSFQFTLTGAQTAVLGVDHYRYQFTCTEGDNRYLVKMGAIEVLPALADVSGGLDTRSSAAILFDAIDAVMMQKATQDQSSLAIGGRSLSRYSWIDLSQMRGYYAHQMTNTERIERGFSPYGSQQVRFVR